MPTGRGVWHRDANPCAELACVERKRPQQGANDAWTPPQDPDAKITTMKDGRTHLDLHGRARRGRGDGAAVGVTAQDAETDAETGDTTTMVEMLTTAAEQLNAMPPAHASLTEVVGDKGSFSNETRGALSDLGLHSGLRRLSLRGYPNILKQLLVHICCMNLGQLTRHLTGAGCATAASRGPRACSARRSDPQAEPLLAPCITLSGSHAVRSGESAVDRPHVNAPSICCTVSRIRTGFCHGRLVHF